MENCCRVAQEKIKQMLGELAEADEQDPEEGNVQCREFTPYFCTVLDRLGICNITCCATQNLSMPKEEVEQLCSDEDLNSLESIFAHRAFCGTP